MRMELRSTTPAEMAAGLDAPVHAGGRALPGVRRAQPVAVRAARRTLDVLVAGAGLLALAPVIAIIAIAVRADTPGPVLFRQRRVGRDLRHFTVLKFRSMAAAADTARHREYVQELIARGNDDAPSEGGLYKLAVDDRVTRAGRFLRKTSLDELPQLWNVLRGEMSLVGPRPVIPYEVEQYPEWYLDRFAVRPGLTGLWQVSGRNERTYEEMVSLDIEYARRQSLGLDVLILFKTLWVVLSGRGVA
jgi:lipopolysaccharide/colanic/teichoic acid biosynthesis glycosyltransferase